MHLGQRSVVLQFLPDKVVDSEEVGIGEPLLLQLCGNYDPGVGQDAVPFAVELVVVARQALHPELLQAHVGAAIPEQALLRVGVTQDLAHGGGAHALHRSAKDIPSFLDGIIPPEESSQVLPHCREAVPFDDLADGVLLVPPNAHRPQFGEVLVEILLGHVGDSVFRPSLVVRLPLSALGKVLFVGLPIRLHGFRVGLNGFLQTSMVQVRPSHWVLVKTASYRGRPVPFANWSNGQRSQFARPAG